MSLPDNYKILSYTSDGSQTEFPILWRFFVKETVLAKVYRDGILEKELTYGQDYSVTPTGETGGKLVLTSPVAKGLVLAISRKEPYIQALELLNSGKIDLVKLEEALDHMVMLAQQNRDDLGRGLQVPPGSDLTPEQFILDLLKKYEEVMAESTLIQTALGNFFCSSIEPFVTQSGVAEYEVVSKIPLDPILNNLFLVLGGVAQEPVTSFIIVDASHIRFTSDPGDGLRCWGVTSLSMSSPDIRLVVEAAIQKIVAEGDKQEGRAKVFADAAAQSAAAAASDAQEVASDKQHVDTVAGQIQGLKIVVNTLNPGEQATASYDPVTGILTLGVPKGDSGDAAIATPTSLGSVMPQTGDEDGLELGTDGKLRVRHASATQRGGVLASTTAKAFTVPTAKEDNTLDASWTADCLKLSGGKLTGPVQEHVVGLSGASVTIDLVASNNFVHVVTEATAFAVVAKDDFGFQLGTLVLSNGGAFAVTWPDTFKWADGAPPSLMTSGIDVITFFTIDKGVTFYAAQAMTGIE